MSRRLVWETDGHDWPHREASRFVEAGGLRWHVQQFDPPVGEGAGDGPPPVALLLHGTGASTHSWSGLAPLLAGHFRVLTLDLPGHGFTSMPAGGPGSSQLSLPGMAGAIAALLASLQMAPALVVGHSAGAAIGARMCLDQRISPRLLLSLNGAFLPLGGMAGQLFSPMAKLMAAAPGVPELFSWRAADPAVLQRLLSATGSTLDSTSVGWYGRLVRSPGHAAGALGMMANWDLPALARDLPRLATPLHLVVGSNDQTVSPRQAGRVQALLPPAAQSGLSTLAGLGHLAHEERPALVADIALAQFSAPRRLQG